MLEADGAFALYVKPLINTLRSSNRTSTPRARALWELFKSDFVRVEQSFKEPISAATVFAHKPALSCVAKRALDLHRKETLIV
ncbi:hypothetical protein BDZ89DRAFT_1078587 [Hymenopellis radicata]|nr:hypothetical protein BDZ89DRAFT_1078587 [Hymenopellis radicata]